MFRIVLSVLGALLLSSCSLLAGRTPPGSSIEEAGFVKLGGIEQWTSVRARRADNPVLLVIHGGPGDILSPYIDEFAAYEANFVVVQWDQRGAGRTYGRNGAQTPEVSLDRIVKDGLELAGLLRNRFGRKIVLFGHSWGSVVGVEMVRRQPELFRAYVGTGQVAGWAADAQAQFQFLQNEAARPDGAPLRATLAEIGTLDPGDSGDLRILNREIRKHLGPADASWLGNLLQRAREVSTAQEFADADAGMTLSGRALAADMRAENLFQTAPRLAVPVTLIQGKDDLFTPTGPAGAWLAALQAPRKTLVEIPGAGHFALLTHSAAVRDALRSAVDH